MAADLRHQLPVHVGDVVQRDLTDVGGNHLVPVLLQDAEAVLLEDAIQHAQVVGFIVDVLVIGITIKATESTNGAHSTHANADNYKNKVEYCRDNYGSDDQFPGETDPKFLAPKCLAERWFSSTIGASRIRHP